MAKQKALGRGLSNLIPVGEDKEPLEGADAKGLQEIKLKDIKPNPTQPRKHFDEGSIRELSETIKNYGIIQPIVVQRVGDTYAIISGERRYRACQLAGFVKIPAIVKEVDENERFELALIENIQRQDLNPLEEALAYKMLSDTQGLKITELATKLGKNRTTISNLIRLLQLPDSIQDWIREGKLSEGHARPLLSLADKRKMEQIASMIIEKGWSVRQVEDFVGSILEEKPNSGKSKTTKKKEATIADIEDKLRKKLSARVEVQHNSQSGKGKITIAYHNLEAMEAVLQKLGI